MKKYKIAGIDRGPATSRVVENSLYRAIKCAGSGDMDGMFAAVETMADNYEAIPAENVTVLLRAALMAEPPTQMGRRPMGVNDRIVRLCDGIAAIQGKKISRRRSSRDLERCMAEARQAFGANLERWENFENDE